MCSQPPQAAMDPTQETEDQILKIRALHEEENDNSGIYTPSSEPGTTGSHQESTSSNESNEHVCPEPVTPRSLENKEKKDSLIPVNEALPLPTVSLVSASTNEQKLEATEVTIQDEKTTGAPAPIKKQFIVLEYLPTIGDIYVRSTPKSFILPWALCQTWEACHLPSFDMRMLIYHRVWQS
jgi:hypothetical protein